MKVRAIKSFVSGRYAAGCGETVDMEDYRAQQLIASGIAEVAEPEAEETEAVEPETIPAPAKKRTPRKKI